MGENAIDIQSSGTEYYALIFDFSSLSEEESDAFNEMFEGHEFLESIEDVIPFAALIKDEEFTDEITLEDLQDFQLEGCLYLEKDTMTVFHSDEGTSNEFCAKLENLIITKISDEEE